MFPVEHGKFIVVIEMLKNALGIGSQNKRRRQIDRMLPHEASFSSKRLTFRPDPFIKGVT
jgi:hypothetical protein